MGASSLVSQIPPGEHYNSSFPVMNFNWNPYCRIDPSHNSRESANFDPVSCGALNMFDTDPKFGVVIFGDLNIRSEMAITLL